MKFLPTMVLLYRLLNWEIAAQQVSQFHFLCVFLFALPVSIPSHKFLETPATKATGSKILGSYTWVFYSSKPWHKSEFSITFILSDLALC